MSVVVAFLSPSDIGASLREGFFMFWATLWALILGFTLSGAVQAFVSREQMQRTLGDHRPPAIARATGFGMVSSSCSYAATAMAKSLFQKGADFVSAMVFMFASTNLVLELGIVLVVLMGWQFAAAEFVGGAIMIVLLALTGTFVVRNAVAERARVRLGGGDAGGRSPHDGHDHDRGHDHDGGHGATTRAGWSDAAGYTIADITMLRRELVIGYVVAGFLSVLVPMEWWNEIFLQGHGFWTSLENVLVGPLIACISFVCSIGNVPMAAALWHGGISFGGVISFIFADLIALPLLLIYRKYYGRALAGRLFLWFYAVMATAGLVTEGIFHLAGAIPTVRPDAIVSEHFDWSYTTFLNIVFLAIFAVLYQLHRSQTRSAADTRYAVDPVCGMQVEKAHAPAYLVTTSGEHWFCSDRCCERYERDRAPSA